MPNESDKSGQTFPIDLVAIVLVVVLFSFLVLVVGQLFLQDPDTYWHIETGRWIWTEQNIPRHDIFSHTAFGQPWLDKEWLSQIILYFSYSALGWHGPVLLTALAITLTFVAMYLLLVRELRATVTLGIITIAFIFASNHFLARPHLLTYPIVVLWTAFLVRARDENRRPSLWLLPLMTLWANLHGGFSFGLVLAAGFTFEAIVAARASERRRVAIEWSVFCVLALLAGCITPYGYHNVLGTIDVLNLGPVLQQNTEWRPMDADHDFVHEGILLVLLMLALSFGTKLSFPRALLVVGILHLGLRHVRGLPMVALTWPLMLARPLQTQYAFLRPSHDPWPLFGVRKSGRFPVLICSAAAAVMMVATSAVFVQVARVNPSLKISPKAAVDFALAQNLTGPVLNDFDFGGYLIFRGIKTFIDGRTLPFGKKFAVDYFEAMRLGNLERLGAMADTYKVTWTLLQPGTTMAYYFDHSPRWRQVYADDIAVICVRR